MDTLIGLIRKFPMEMALSGVHFPILIQDKKFVQSNMLPIKMDSIQF